jgi:hypothetical protein
MTIPIKPISGFPNLAAANVQPNILFIVDDVNDTSSASTGTTKNLALQDALNNPENGDVAGIFVPALQPAAVTGAIVRTSQNGMVFKSPGGLLTDYALLGSDGTQIAAGRDSDSSWMVGKFIGLSVAPTVAPGAAAGTGATVSVIGSDSAGLITVVTGTGTTTGIICTLTFSSPYGGGATGVVNYGNSCGPLYPPLYTTTLSGTLTIGCTAAGTLSTAATYLFNYQVIGYGN